MTLAAASRKARPSDKEHGGYDRRHTLNVEFDLFQLDLITLRSALMASMVDIIVFSEGHGRFLECFHDSALGCKRYRFPGRSLLQDERLFFSVLA